MKEEYFIHIDIVSNWIEPSDRFNYQRWNRMEPNKTNKESRYSNFIFLEIRQKPLHLSVYRGPLYRNSMKLEIASLSVFWMRHVHFSTNIPLLPRKKSSFGPNFSHACNHTTLFSVSESSFYVPKSLSDEQRSIFERKHEVWTEFQSRHQTRFTEKHF